ncbi:helix-turn-helix transcriptional regulator [Streptomyces sp. NPDC004647]|uniref:helix-turn-helix domain-containing protein n=1 Tax=Streptomyces sp. NPDC004647 TaxID=3154671 RepID=UPI0033A2D9B2
MGVPTGYSRCAYCGRRFLQRTGPGRKKDYCDKACRRRAQRQRDGQSAPLPVESCLWGQPISENVHVLAARLVEAEHVRVPLPVLLEHAQNLARELDYYTAAAVHDARRGGSNWEAVATAAQVTVDTARERWGESKVKRLLTRRARGVGPCTSHRIGAQRPAPATEGEAAAAAPATEGTTSTPPAAVRTSQKLAAALSHLQRRSGMTISDAAQQADLSPSYISRVLAGDRVPAWPVVHMLATIFGGRASELRILWESAQGVASPCRQTVEGAARRLQDALRGLYLAAACPDLVRLSAGDQLAAEAAGEVLDGDVVPDWTTTSALVARLGGRPAEIRPLWEDVHYAFLTSHDVFPRGGLPRSGLPGAESGASAHGV